MGDYGGAGDCDEGRVFRAGDIVGGRFRIRRVLGVGGMGEVYEATQTLLDRTVAIKVLRPEAALRKDAEERFVAEAQGPNRIGHPNIIEVTDMFWDPDAGVWCIVQEYLKGETLLARLHREGRLPPREALDIVIPILGALVAAHRRGILHRDLKPENIFLARRPEGGETPKLLDFGVAKFMDLTRPPTSANRVIGTLAYMSPEQIQADRSLDGQTDVWAMGVVLFELMSGWNPFAAGGDYIASVHRVSIAPIPSLLDEAPEVPQSLAAVVHRALERDRADRWPTMRAFLEAILECPAYARDPAPRAFATRHAASIPRVEVDPSEGSTSPDPAESLGYAPTLPSVPAPPDAVAGLSRPVPGRASAPPPRTGDGVAAAIDQPLRSGRVVLAALAVLGVAVFGAWGVHRVSERTSEASVAPARPAPAPAADSTVPAGGSTDQPSPPTVVGASDSRLGGDAGVVAAPPRAAQHSAILTRSRPPRTERRRSRWELPEVSSEGEP